MKTDALRFFESKTVVHVLTHPSHPPISLSISEFNPPDENFLSLPEWTPNLPLPERTPRPENRKNVFTAVSTLPYALSKFSIDQLVPQFMQHLEAISKRERITGDSETLTWKLMQAICRFEETDPFKKHACTPLRRGFEQRTDCE